MVDQTDVDILRLFAAGMTVPSIGRQLGLSERTVRRRLRKVCDELDLGSPIEAVVWAVRRGVL